MDRKPSLTLDATKKRLDSVSPTFCSAKWTQVLFQLHLGQLHNCCLTAPQPIEKNDLFNSSQLQNERQKMLQGEAIKECGVCWQAESKGWVSDRTYKSSEPWAQEVYQKISVNDVIPSYIEISLSNRCNFKCVYCSPENSSSIYRESKEFGPYRLHEDFNYSGHLEPSVNYFLENEENPYVDAFLKWYPAIYKKVQVLRFTGGEPLLSHKLYEFLDLIKMYPSPELELIFNSNLGVPTQVMQKFLNKLKELPQGCYGKVGFITSIDGWGVGATIARNGLNLSQFEENLNLIRSEFPKADLRFTSTINVYGMPHFKALLEKVLFWKQSQFDSDQILITPYPLYYPPYLSIAWCGEAFDAEVKEIKEFIQKNFVGDEQKNGFKTVERDMIFKAIDHRQSHDQKRHLQDFALYTCQMLYRRKLDLTLLDSKVQQLVEQGLQSIREDFEQESIDPLYLLRAFFWAKIPPEEVQKKLAPLLLDGTINRWAVVEILLDYSRFLDLSWLRWFYDIDLPTCGNKLLARPEFCPNSKASFIVLEAWHKGRGFCWESLGHDYTIEHRLGKNNLMLLRSWGSHNLEPQLIFWQKVLKIFPDF